MDSLESVIVDNKHTFGDDKMGTKANLTSIPTLVESPFIIATIGGYTFGSYTAEGSAHSYGASVKVSYPNFMKSMNITKINGTVNTYTLNFSYQVATGQDPNLLDKIFSKATKDRQITLKYGDWNAPSYIYKEEVAIITSITCSLNMSNQSIDYSVNCTSDAIGLTSMSYNFPAREAKPSDVLKQLLNNPRYGLKSVFTGMKDSQSVLSNNLIASNDKKVSLLAKKNTTPLSYMNYLVDCMSSTANSSGSPIQRSSYYLSIHDDTSNQMGGTYFKVTEVTGNTSSYVATDTYEVDINYPDDNFVTQFTLNNDQSWAILYEYSQSVKQEEYTYSINDEGKLVSEYAPSLVRSKVTNGASSSKSSWWTKMTQFPISATLTIKGLTRPSILMSYVKVNVWFTGGQKHISSGLYIITKQVDNIDSSGYKTTLTLQRVGGDE